MPRLRQIICSKCQSEMFLGRIQEGPSGYDLRTFECHRCSHELKTAVKLGDPKQSKAVMAWLQDQLVASK
jgi:DNA-directed RNA polymerase subunit RPC12/RpoP